MNRLQKKCFFAAAGLHLLLALILLIGPAFLTSNNQSQDVPELNFVAFKTVDALVSGGGDPKGALPPSPAPPQAKPDVTPPAAKPEIVVKSPAPEPVKVEKIKEVVPPKDASDSLEPSKNSKHKIDVSTTPVVRKTDVQAIAKARAAADAKAAAAERQRIASALNHAASSIAGNLSGETSVVLKGPGGGGVPYGNWLSAVKQRYTDAWIVPDGVTDDSATVKASVTIARNGEVLASSIVQSSGNPLVDHSVKATLDRVTTAPPLPEGAKEDQRTVTINFNVKAKQGLG
jgi:TonB family protein